MSVTSEFVAADWLRDFLEYISEVVLPLQKFLIVTETNRPEKGRANKARNASYRILTT